MTPLPAAIPARLAPLLCHLITCHRLFAPILNSVVFPTVNPPPPPTFPRNHPSPHAPPTPPLPSRTVSARHNTGAPDQNPGYFAAPLIGSCSSPWGNFAPITKDSLSSALHECQKPEGKIAGEALVESSYSVLTFDFHKTRGEVAAPPTDVIGKTPPPVNYFIFRCLEADALFLRWDFCSSLQTKTHRLHLP